MTSTWIQSQPASSTALTCKGELAALSGSIVSNMLKCAEHPRRMYRIQIDVRAMSHGCRLCTCSPSLAKSADRMEGDTMTSFLENLQGDAQFGIMRYVQISCDARACKLMHRGSRWARCIMHPSPTTAIMTLLLELLRYVKQTHLSTRDDAYVVTARRACGRVQLGVLNLWPRSMMLLLPMVNDAIVAAVTVGEY